MPPTPAGASAVTVDQILDEVVPSAGASRAESMPTLPTAGTRATRRTTSSRLSQRPAPVRRRYAEYAEEYKYIWADLRRIFIVAGVLIALLIVAAFFIE